MKVLLATTAVALVPAFSMADMISVNIVDPGEVSVSWHEDADEARQVHMAIAACNVGIADLEFKDGIGYVAAAHPTGDACIAAARE